MMRKASNGVLVVRKLVLLLLMFAAVPLGAETVLNSAETAKKVSAAVVAIYGQTEVGQVEGSGFLVSSDGKVVTSLHVIRGIRHGSVQLAGGDIFDSFTVSGVDERRDLAIIQISGFALPAIELGDSNELRPGDPVLLAGRPRGLQGSITAGVISGVRELSEGFKLIQTDAAVSAGNSGGALVNARGQVVGVLGFKLEDSSGLNFAVPINYVRRMLNDLAATVNVAKLAAGSTESTRIQGLTDVKKLAVLSFGPTHAARLVREKLTNRLAKSGQFVLVEEPRDADVVLTGVVGYNFRGWADTASIRLSDVTGRLLWGAEARSPGRWGSASSNIAGKLADHLLNAIKKDRKGSNK
jgi:S1-C subfamily serine protease